MTTARRSRAHAATCAAATRALRRRARRSRGDTFPSRRAAATGGRARVPGCAAVRTSKSRNGRSLTWGLHRARPGAADGGAAARPRGLLRYCRSRRLHVGRQLTSRAPPPQQRSPPRAPRRRRPPTRAEADRFEMMRSKREARAAAAAKLRRRRRPGAVGRRRRPRARRRCGGRGAVRLPRARVAAGIRGPRGDRLSGHGVGRSGLSRLRNASSAAAGGTRARPQRAAAAAAARARAPPAAGRRCRSSSRSRRAAYWRSCATCSSCSAGAPGDGGGRRGCPRALALASSARTRTGARRSPRRPGWTAGGTAPRARLDSSARLLDTPPARPLSRCRCEASSRRAPRSARIGARTLRASAGAREASPLFLRPSRPRRPAALFAGPGSPCLIRTTGRRYPCLIRPPWAHTARDGSQTARARRLAFELEDGVGCGTRLLVGDRRGHVDRAGRGVRLLGAPGAAREQARRSASRSRSRRA